MNDAFERRVNEVRAARSSHSLLEPMSTLPRRFPVDFGPRCGLIVFREGNRRMGRRGKVIGKMTAGANALDGTPYARGGDLR